MLFQEGETMKKTIRAATAQFNHKPGDKEYNLRIIADMCRKAASNEVRIITFPEMCVTGYWHVRKLDRSQVEALSENALTGETARKLKALSVQYNMIIGAGIIEKGEDGKLYNSYIVTQPDRETRLHRKLHCFISEHMASGDEYTVIETSLGAKIGVLICWDNNLIENGRCTALLGADILMAPHQTGGCVSRSLRVLGKIDLKLWEERKTNPGALRGEFQSVKGAEWLKRWLPARAHDNGMFLLFSNGVGRDDDEVRTGNAMIIDCFGEVLAESKEIGDDMVAADLDLHLLSHATGRNWIKGRRPELYGEITKERAGRMDVRTLKAIE